MATAKAQSVSYAEVAMPLPIYGTFTYSLPDSSAPPPVGVRVVAPFGNRRLTGILVETHRRTPQRRTRQIVRLLDERPVLPPPLMELGKWLSAYYFSPPGETFRVMLPPGLLSRKDADEKNRFPRPQRQWAVAEVCSPVESLTERQREILELLASRPLPALLKPFVREANTTVRLIKGLADRGAVRLERIELHRSPWEGAAEKVEKHRLNPDQARISAKIQQRLAANAFHSMLIHGVTGSGKTEIYLNAISATLERGKSALMLVPEIGLTPQAARAFRGWFGKKVAILHSRLSEGERFDQWRRIREGGAEVVIGTRSAVFAPLSNLGIVIVDEEHDSSYKQETLPRYNGRDTALKRGQIEGALVVLGSATPQLEVYFQSVDKLRHEYESLTTRILRRPLPTVHIVDMRTEFQKHGKAVAVSELLERSIAQRLQRRQQSLILLNRRGYSSQVLCRSCGFVESCENCSITLTHHLSLNRLVCHYCGYAKSVPARCRECGQKYIYFLGEGTEKIEEKLQRLFPQAKVGRLDRDAVSRKGSLRRILADFAARRIDVLVGTQMIAKGHDFPYVTLVGVLAADRGLRMADFRAAERTFQLLTQVSGRAGRGETPGDVVVQTYYPNHYSLKYACAQDYGLFYEREIQFRRGFRYPPFTALANLFARGEDRLKTQELMEEVAERLRQGRTVHSSQRRLRILGPAPAPLEKLKGEFRFQVLIKTTSRRELHLVLRHCLAELEPKILSRITVDVDPVNLL